MEQPSIFYDESSNEYIPNTYNALKHSFDKENSFNKENEKDIYGDGDDDSSFM